MALVALGHSQLNVRLNSMLPPPACNNGAVTGGLRFTALCGVLTGVMGSNRTKLILFIFPRDHVWHTYRVFQLVHTVGLNIK